MKPHIQRANHLYPCRKTPCIYINRPIYLTAKRGIAVTCKPEIEDYVAIDVYKTFPVMNMVGGEGIFRRRAILILNYSNRVTACLLIEEIPKIYLNSQLFIYLRLKWQWNSRLHRLVSVTSTPNMLFPAMGCVLWLYLTIYPILLSHFRINFLPRYIMWRKLLSIYALSSVSKLTYTENIEQIAGN